MVVDEDPMRGEMLGQALAAAGFLLVGRVLAGDFLPVRVAEAKPDVILIDVDSPSRDTLERITALSDEEPRPIVMFSGDDDKQTIHNAVTAGVSAYVVDGLQNSRIQPVIEVAIAQFRQHQALRTELHRTRDDLADRKDIDRAKGLIMKQRGCDEP
ncbi:MAG: response regulator, partial [Planctomycetota bacterium]